MYFETSGWAEAFVAVCVLEAAAAAAEWEGACSTLLLLQGEYMRGVTPADLISSVLMCLQIPVGQARTNKSFSAILGIPWGWKQVPKGGTDLCQRQLSEA